MGCRCCPVTYKAIIPGIIIILNVNNHPGEELSISPKVIPETLYRQLHTENYEDWCNRGVISASAKLNIWWKKLEAFIKEPFFVIIFFCLSQTNLSWFWKLQGSNLIWKVSKYFHYGFGKTEMTINKYSERCKSFCVCTINKQFSKDIEQSIMGNKIFECFPEKLCNVGLAGVKIILFG